MNNPFDNYMNQLDRQQDMEEHWSGMLFTDDRVNEESVRQLKSLRNEINKLLNKLLKKIGNRVCTGKDIQNLDDVRRAYDKDVLNDHIIETYWGTPSRVVEAVAVRKQLEECLGQNSNSFGRKVLYRGARGGVYYKRKGRKVYVNQFGL